MILFITKLHALTLMRGRSLYIIVIGLLISVVARSQTGDYTQGTTQYFICKLPVLTPVILKGMRARLLEKISASSSNVSRKLLLSVDGELSYQHFNRQASSDNLLLINSASNIASLRMNIVYKETYPFTLALRYNRSQPFQLDNQYEVNIGFDERGFRELLRDKMTSVVRNSFLRKQADLLRNYENVHREFQEKKQYLESPVYAQRMIELRQQEVRNLRINAPTNPLAAINIPGLPSLPDTEAIKQRVADSINRRVHAVTDKIHAGLEAKKDSLIGILKKIEDSLSAHKQELNRTLDSVNKELSAMASGAQLKKYADKKGWKDSLPTNGWADLLMKTRLRLGKFILNNSELTVNNIFLQGISVTYGHEKFVTLSGGYYDFSFREIFNFRNDSLRLPRKPVMAIRFGKTDGRNLSAVNFYVGRKEKAGSLGHTLRTIAGVSYERKFSINRNISIEMELAKSTTRINSPADKETAVLKDLFTRFSSRTIGAYGSLQAYLPKTKTDASVSYRYWGQQFESFNASQYFNPQNNLTAKLSQPLFKRKLYLTAGLRYTDFKSLGIGSNIKTKTMFATANATLRIKKLPVISVGYYPGSQLYWMDNSKLYEYFYYILNTTASHYFKAGKIPMQAVFTYNKFYNKYTDSLVTGAQSYYNLFWTAWVGKFSCQANYSRQLIESTSLHTTEAGLSYNHEQFRVGGSAKWNKLTAQMRMGYSVNIGILLRKLGSVNFIYDRSFLPDRTGLFIPVETGQVQIIKPLKFRIWQKG
jgi:hypothetical protein